jgi:translation initiation factor IF-3
MILNRLAEELAELAVVEQRPQQDGRNMTMMLAPSRQAAADGASGESDGGGRSRGRNGGGRSGSRRDREAAERAAAASEPEATETDEGGEGRSAAAG